MNDRYQVRMKWGRDISTIGAFGTIAEARACNEVGIKPTIRQASKWRRRKGKAWKDYGRMLRSNFERSTEGR